MNYSWFRTVFPIAAIFSFRMLGLFLLIPVFTVYARDLDHATPALIGLALGGYGLSQGLLQLPFGMLSDKYGRKPLLTIGLLLLACGSMVGALSHSIYGMIIARTLQGAGAIGSVLIALLADLTPDEQRTKAMAVIGMTIGTSFSLAMVISPGITHRFGLEGIFYLTFVFAILGLILLRNVVPNLAMQSERKPSISLIKMVIRDTQLQYLNIGIFCQHFILTSTFFAIPLLLQTQISSGKLTELWYFYLPLMLASFILMVPFILIAERKKLTKSVFIFSVLITTISQYCLAWNNQNLLGLCTLMFVYLVAFNILEATLPSLVSKQADPQSKGTAMGVYSTSQFLGIFAGGSLAGITYQFTEAKGIFTINALLGLAWLIVAVFMHIKQTKTQPTSPTQHQLI